MTLQIAPDIEMAPPPRSQVNRAGNLLKEDPELAPNSNALLTLSGWRAAHLPVLLTFSQLVRRIRSTPALAGSETLIAMRLKSQPSIRLKLQRFSGRLSTMQDLAGIRVILPSMPEVTSFTQSLLNSGTVHVLKKPPYDYITKPKSDGYRSIHLVYGYHGAKHPKLDGLLVEIQIRTRLQHAWATAVETLGVIEHSAFKSGVGDESFKRFFKLSSALLSLDEKTLVLEEFKDVAPAELVAEFENLESELNVFKKLTGVTIAAKRILTSSRNAYYQLTCP